MFRTRIALALALGVVALAPATADDQAAELNLLGLNFIVDDAATVLPMEKDEEIAVDNVAERLAKALKDNGNLFARMESIRRAAHHLMRNQDQTARNEEAKQVINGLKDCYVEKGGQLGRIDADPAKTAEKNSGTRMTADKIDAQLRERLYARADLSYALALFASANLLDESVTVDLKPCKAYLREAMATQPMPELSFCAAVLGSAKFDDKLQKKADETKAKESGEDLQALEAKNAEQGKIDTELHLKEAVDGSVSGDLIDRNLVHCFGVDRVRKLRGEPATSR